MLCKNTLQLCILPALHMLRTITQSDIPNEFAFKLLVSTLMVIIQVCDTFHIHIIYIYIKNLCFFSLQMDKRKTPTVVFKYAWSQYFFTTSQIQILKFLKKTLDLKAASKLFSWMQNKRVRIIKLYNRLLHFPYFKPAFCVYTSRLFDLPFSNSGANILINRSALFGINIFFETLRRAIKKPKYIFHLTEIIQKIWLSSIFLCNILQ